MSDGPTSTSQPSRKVVNVITKKQAQWIKSLKRERPLSQTSKPKWTQIVTRPGTVTTSPQPSEVWATYPKGSYLSPTEIAKKHPEHGIILYGRHAGDAQHVSTAKTQNQLTAEAFAKPASSDCIMAHLIRATAILHLKGAAAEDGVQSAFLLSDYTTRLMEIKTTEVDLFLALEHFIETNEDGFFPTIAKLLKYVGKG
jgi:hypothetical protein